MRYNSFNFSILFVLFFFTVVCSSCKQDSQQQVGGQQDDDFEKRLTNTAKDAELHYLRAQKYFDQKNYDLAINDLGQAIKWDSLNPTYYHLLSDCNMDYYRSKNALMIMEQAAKLFPERIATLLKLSETQLILQQHEQSLMTVARIFTLDSENAEAHFMKGMNFRALKQVDLAINAFQKVTELNPEHIDAWLMAGELLEQKDDKIALDYYNAALRIDPKNTTAIHSKAYYFQTHGSDNKAIELYKQISVVDKNYLDAYLNSGILYMTMDSLDRALEQFNIMASIKPQNHLPYYYRGLIYDARGKVTAARNEFQNCLNLNPDFTKAKKAINNLSNS